jgi:hypothetical protein
MLSVATAETVLAKISASGFTRRADFDTPYSYAFTYLDHLVSPAKEHLFFVPHELASGGYTIDQLNEIEKALACFGYDLLPLDPNLMH